MLKQVLQILVIEDNPGDYVLVEEYLKEGFPSAEILHAESIISATPILKKNHVDVVLLDLTLPDGMGIESFHAIQTIAPLVPIIILTGMGDRDIALESVKFGAQDYIVKDDSNTMVLQKSIQYGIERSKVLDHLKKSEEQYKYLFQNNPLPMWAFDKIDGKFIMVNGAAIRQYGYTEEEFLKMTIYDIEVADDSRVAISSSFLKRSSLNKNFTSDLKHRKKSGAIIDVNNIIADLKVLYQNRLKTSNGIIECETIPLILGRKSQVMQLFQNLLGNAIKYQSNEPPVIKISVKDVGNFVEFAVADNGIGIDERFFNKIFIIFQRLHNREQYSGTGIGLAICKKIVDRHGGKIWLTSTPGKGSTFYFTLPR
jgi:PAS domain S-box-containing protein